MYKDQDYGKVVVESNKLHCELFQSMADDASAAAELKKIKQILDERLWFIDRPLAERVKLLTEQYVEQQEALSDYTHTYGIEIISNRNKRTKGA
jgi:hypothetical protein